MSDFLGSMGVMSADLGYDCADCHVAAGTDKVNWEFDTPKKKTARKMVEMVAVINKTNFAGVQMVTCWTCHHGRFMPATTIALDALYGTPNDERMTSSSPAKACPPPPRFWINTFRPSAEPQKLAGLTSFIATGTSVGYEGLGGGGSFQIFAKSPDQRTTLIAFKDHPERGDSTRAYNGTAGWIKSPRGLLPEYDLTGSELDGARLDALLSFPGQIKTALNNWRAGSLDSIGDKEVQVVQGSGPARLARDALFRHQDRPAGALDALQRVAHRPRSHADRLLRLSRRQRHQVPVQIHVLLVGWQRFLPTQRREDQCPDRRREVRQTLNAICWGRRRRLLRQILSARRRARQCARSPGERRLWPGSRRP